MLACALAPAVGRCDPVSLDQITAQLFYSMTGTLSQNIAPPAHFSSWNTVIGEGDAKEPATDLVVGVVLTAAQPQTTDATPLVVTARQPGGKVLAQRTYRNILVERGRLVKVLFLPDVTCIGQIDIVATLGAQTRSATVHLDCGE